MLERHFHRRNLPHLYYNEGEYFITFRLKNSLPLNEIKKLKDELEKKASSLSAKEKRLFIKYDELLDSGKFGIPLLKKNEIADIIKNIIHMFDGLYYNLICYCIMPNHVHLVFSIFNNEKSLSDIMKLIKGNSSIMINRFLNRRGNLWQPESFDRLIRDDKELYQFIKYVLLNPVKAKLVDDWQNWSHTYCHPDFIVL
uniref:Transposase IS200-like domain-containing protein n=1 Tax=Ignavibacterium album TaxID=591197 RepID=A0A832DIR7_9BACT